MNKMNLDEFRNALSSDATKENEKLKQKIVSLEKELDELKHNLVSENEKLKDDCRALSNRCHILSKGAMCIWCQLRSYHCEHELDLDTKLNEAKNMMGNYK